MRSRHTCDELIRSGRQAIVISQMRLALNQCELPNQHLVHLVAAGAGGGAVGGVAGGGEPGPQS